VHYGAIGSAHKQLSLLLLPISTYEDLDLHSFQHGSVLLFSYTILLAILIPTSLQKFTSSSEVYSPPLSDLSILIFLTEGFSYQGFEFLDLVEYFKYIQVFYENNH
jgi:hypothetical protein